LKSELSASEKAKELELKSLKEVEEMTGKCRATLHNWSKEHPEFFELVLLGCCVRKFGEYSLKWGQPKKE